jgi:hypothetical protein
MFLLFCLQGLLVVEFSKFRVFDLDPWRIAWGKGCLCSQDPEVDWWKAGMLSGDMGYPYHYHRGSRKTFLLKNV